MHVLFIKNFNNLFFSKFLQLTKSYEIKCLTKILRLTVLLLLSKPHIYNHTYTATNPLHTTTNFAPRNKQTVRLAWLTDSRRTTDTGMNGLPSSQQPPNKLRQFCPRHQCFEKFVSHQLGVSRLALPKLCHLLTKHRQRQQTPLAVIRCFLDFSSPCTPAFTPGL